MRELKKPVIVLIVIMCLIRTIFALVGYINPQYLIGELGENMPDVESYYIYMTRVWGIRDVVIGVLTLLAIRKNVVPLLIACAIIDGSDALAAYGNYARGLSSLSNAVQLIWVALSCFIPEVIALILIKRGKNREALEERI